MKKIVEILESFNKNILYLSEDEIPTNNGTKPAICNRLDSAIKYQKEYLFDLIIIDIQLNESKIKIAKFLSKIKKQGIRLIVFSEKDDFNSVFFAYQSGADIFLPKKDINITYFKTAIELFLKGYNRIIISKNRAMQRNYQLLSFYAKIIKTDILILGENGTGKGIIAKAMHKLSDTKGDFFTQNCAGIPDALFESEIFGYLAGAFTGADKKGKKGVIAQADNGILFLDEIGELPLNQQAKLLRVIQRKVILPVGSSKEEKVNLRFIFATNKDLFLEVQNGSFREDFYYRLKGAEIYILPLRETKDDIEIMIAVFANRFLQEQATFFTNKKIKLDSKSYEKLIDYNFPGNMRELQKIVYQAMINMLMQESNILFFEVPEKNEISHIENVNSSVETFWQIIELLENGMLKYGGLVPEIKKNVLDHLRTKYHDDRNKIAKILQFKDKQSLANEIHRSSKL